MCGYVIRFSYFGQTILAESENRFLNLTNDLWHHICDIWLNFIRRKFKLMLSSARHPKPLVKYVKKCNSLIIVLGLNIVPKCYH